MFIRTVDDGLARMLRAEVPLPADDVDIDFAVPDAAWQSALTRPTVNFFLYDVRPSDRPIPAPNRRLDEYGRPLRRRNLPIVDLNYSVSVWAADPLVEHDLLGQLVSRFAGTSLLADTHLPDDAENPIVLFFGAEHTPVHVIWQAIGAGVRSSFSLTVATAAEAFEWTPQAAPVTEIVHSFTRTVE